MKQLDFLLKKQLTEVSEDHFFLMVLLLTYLLLKLKPDSLSSSGATKGYLSDLYRFLSFQKSEVPDFLSEAIEIVSTVVMECDKNGQNN